MAHTAYHSPIDVDGICTRKQEGAFIYSPISDNAWHPVSPVTDFALTFGTFVLAMVAPVAFVVWMVLS